MLLLIKTEIKSKSHLTDITDITKWFMIISFQTEFVFCSYCITL